MAGSGLLVGTALSVIIPEGVSALYSAQHHEGKAMDRGPVDRMMSEVDERDIEADEIWFGQVGDY